MKTRSSISSTRRAPAKSRLISERVTTKVKPTRRSSVAQEKRRGKNTRNDELEDGPKTKRRKVASKAESEPSPDPDTLNESISVRKSKVATARTSKKVIAEPAGIIARRPHGPSKELDGAYEGTIVEDNPTDDVASVREERLKHREKESREMQKTLKRKLKEFKAESQQTQRELDVRQAAVSKREQEVMRLKELNEKKALALKKREDLLRKQELGLKNQEQEAHDLTMSLTLDRAEVISKQLEDQFTCALCFDVMACPYNLIPAQCGHSFCALCVLKWFFSHLHSDCGGWHDQLECPLCRSLLPFPSGEPPRSMLTCPFTPNRLADKVLTDLIQSMRGSVSSSNVVGSNKRSNGKKKAVQEDASSLWCEGGVSRNEWLERDRRGRTEMAFVTSSWSKLSPSECRAIKNRLAA